MKSLTQLAFGDSAVHHDSDSLCCPDYRVNHIFSPTNTETNTNNLLTPLSLFLTDVFLPTLLLLLLSPPRRSPSSLPRLPQAALLNSFPAIFDELLQMFTVQEVAEFVRGTLGSMPSTVHIGQSMDVVKLQSIARTVDSRLFSFPGDTQTHRIFTTTATLYFYFTPNSMHSFLFSAIS